MRQFETRNVAIEIIARALRPYHRHGDEENTYDALCVEFADLSTNSLTALQAALQRREVNATGALTEGK
jgi:hypothetical protein